MIGIDITNIKKFKYPVERYNKKFKSNYKNIREVAKFWACFEALFKANDKPFYPNQITIFFNPGQPPKVVDRCNVLKSTAYISISHDDDIICAVAIFKD